MSINEKLKVLWSIQSIAVSFLFLFLVLLFVKKNVLAEICSEVPCALKKDLQNET